MLPPTKIFLIGMPGSGKSTLGQQLSDTLNKPFIDLDKEIVKETGWTIPELFAKKGEEYFRQMENRLLKRITNEYTEFVMATGGGVPCFYDAIDYMLAEGFVLYIQVPVDELLERVKGDIPARPKFSGGAGMKQQLVQMEKERSPVYQKAHKTVSGTSITLKDIVTVLP